MGGRLFGTDGVRGLANVDLTAVGAVNLSIAAAHVLGGLESADRGPDQRPLAVVGRDTRASGEFLEAAVVAGLASAGMDVFVVGVLPTPGVAFLTAEEGADLGVMLSASHNPMPDNGIKFFARGGTKLPDADEDAIEARLGRDWNPPVGAAVGRVFDRSDLGEKYLDHLLSATPNRLTGIRAVVDCAHGAASEIGPRAYQRMGAHVTAINASPDGYNINEDCGSTHMESLQRAVLERRADIGIAHDGDADRALVVDAHGRVVDGDQMMAILAVYLKSHGELAHNTLVATVMSNLGLKIAMAEQGIELLETAVGDRYVLEEMRAGGYSLGGEQSGHVILASHASTGDGVLSALTLMSVMASTGQTLAELASIVTVLPQVLINVSGVDKAALEGNEAIAAAVAAASARLGDEGRVLLRKSGTEQLVRVMVEATSDDLAQELAEELADVVRSELALT